MIIVTGGAGFIGSILTAELELRGLGPILVVDELGAGDKWRNIAKRELLGMVPPSEIYETLAKHAREIVAIFHLGAISDTTFADADAMLARNVTYTLNLWEWCAQASVPLIYASSAATYGTRPGGSGKVDATSQLSELRPLNLYGWSKHFIDRRIVYDSHRGKKTPPRWAGFKFFNVYGPNEYHKGNMRSVVCALFDQITAGHAARLFRSQNEDYPDGGQMRDFVYVDDVVDAMIWFMQHGTENGLYDLGTGNARSFLDLANAVFAALGREPQINFVEMPPELSHRYQYFTQANVAPLRRMGWDRNCAGLEAGVQEYTRKYLLAEDRYR